MKHPQAWRLPNYSIQTTAPDPKVEVCGHFHGRFLGGIDTSLFQTSSREVKLLVQKELGDCDSAFLSGQMHMNN